MEVGTKLFAVPTDSRYRHQTEEVVISKVGRQWLTLETERGNHWGRCDKETLIVDGGAYSPRHNLYRSQAEYEAIRDLNAAWREVRHSIVDRYKCPDHIGMGDILAIAAILRCNALPEEPSA